MPHDIASLLFALTIELFTIAVALPAVMGAVNAPARRAQVGMLLQALGWALLLASSTTSPRSWQDRSLSTLAIAGMSGGLALNAAAFELWCGRAMPSRAPAWIAVLMTLGYGLAFDDYAFRVGWSNGLLSLQMVLVVVSLGRRPQVKVGRWRWLLILSLLAQAGVTAWRGVLGAFFTPSYPTFLAPHPVNLAFAIIGNSTTVVTVVAILLAHRDEAARALERLATVDGLTGVFNRGAWFAEAQTQMAVSARYDDPVAVVMIDLDHFKRINDTRGHEAGDQALRQVAAALRASARTGDLVGRYGGEEFCVLMSHADLAAARAFDRRLRTAMASAAADDGSGAHLTFSAGIAMRETPDESLQSMLGRADAALYAAKAQGRARTLDSDGIAAPSAA